MSDSGLDDIAEPDEPAAEQVAALTSRCAAAKIPLESDSDIGIWTLTLPSGRDHRAISVIDRDDFEQLLAVPFEEYTFLSGYAAIANYRRATIEAAVRVLDGPGVHTLLRRFGVSNDDDGDEEATARAVTLSEGNSELKLALGPASDDLNTLTGRPSGPLRGLALAISGSPVKQHDASVSLLRSLANSLFFQVDLTSGIAMMLQPERIAQRRVRRHLRESPALEFPKHEYDAAPISLYWYARSATQMPLLQFLAYYQVIEFYFPTCSQADARRRIRTVLKDPGFRPDRESDVARIFSLLRGTAPGFGDERSQLRATIQECVDPTELREFIGGTSVRAAFLSKKTDGLTDKKIPLGNPDADLRTETADRIYDIRCRIVHTKSSATGLDLEMLLPFSPQAAQLSHDIDLVNFVARRVLVAMSSHLKLGTAG